MRAHGPAPSAPRHLTASPPPAEARGVESWGCGGTRWHPWGVVRSRFVQIVGASVVGVAVRARQHTKTIDGSGIREQRNPQKGYARVRVLGLLVQKTVLFVGCGSGRLHLHTIPGPPGPRELATAGLADQGPCPREQEKSSRWACGPAFPATLAGACGGAPVVHPHPVPGQKGMPILRLIGPYRLDRALANGTPSSLGAAWRCSSIRPGQLATTSAATGAPCARQRRYPAATYLRQA